MGLKLKVDYYPKLKRYRCVSHPSLNFAEQEKKTAFIRLGRLQRLKDEGNEVIIKVNEKEPEIKEVMLHQANDHQLQIWRGDCNCVMHSGRFGSVKRDYTNDWMLGD